MLWKMFIDVEFWVNGWTLH